MKRIYKYRLYPTNSQEENLNETLNTCRILYNNSLAERRDAWKNEHKSINYYEQKHNLVEAKKDNPYLPKVHSQVLQDVVLRLDKSFVNFFRRVKKGEKKVGYPRFKKYGRFKSFNYPQYGNGVELNNNGRLNLSKIGNIKMKLHREMPNDGVIKSCIIKKDVDKWYACFIVETERKTIKPAPIRTVVGIDMGLNDLITLSDGNKIKPPKYLRQSEDKIKKHQRRVSRKKKGSKNNRRSVIKLEKVHRKVRNQRLDFNHKLSRNLVNKFDLIAYEDLKIRNIVKNHYLAKSISDASWGTLNRLIVYKAEEAGKLSVEVNPNGTSQECHRCRKIHDMPLSKRTIECDCGNRMDRDINASINILKRGLIKIGWGTAESTHMETQPLHQNTQNVFDASRVVEV